MFKRKTVNAPTIEERAAQANALGINALHVFRSAADDLEIASQLQSEIAHDLYIQAEALRDEADEIEGQSFELDQAADDNLAAADRIRSLFAA